MPIVLLRFRLSDKKYLGFGLQPLGSVCSWYNIGYLNKIKPPEAVHLLRAESKPELMDVLMIGLPSYRPISFQVKSRPKFSVSELDVMIDSNNRTHWHYFNITSCGVVV